MNLARVTRKLENMDFPPGRQRSDSSLFNRQERTFMMKLRDILATIAAMLLSGTAQAAAFAPGGSISDIVVPGTMSIYQIFGHAGNPGGDYGPATDAALITFAASANNVFTFSVTGLVSCCGGAPNLPPDGGASGMNVGGANGLSGLIGNGNIPFVGVFTTDTDPYGSVAPATLTFDKNNPTSLSPQLAQVFYIGDGKDGYNNASGATLTFTAPATATRLYIGAIDAYSFTATTGYYNDNKGQFTASVSLAPVPLPPAVWLFGSALGGLYFARRRAG
jgi:hypothetical protein